MDWESLKIFILASDATSLSAAARELNISQPTLRRRIADLEDEIGVELIVRSRNGFKLTEGGKEVRQFGLAMKEKADALIGNVQNNIDTESGLIKISGPSSFVSFNLVQQVPQFLDQFPDIRIELSLENIVPDPLTSDVDIAIMHRTPNNPDLITKKIGVIHYLLFASAEYFERQDEPTNPFEIMSHRRGINDIYLTHDFEREPGSGKFARSIDWHFVCDSTDSLATVCANGLGICPLPSFAIYSDPRLQPASLSPVGEVPIILAYSDRTKRLKRGQAVIDWILSSIQGERSYHFDAALDVHRVIQEARALSTKMSAGF